MTNPWSTYEKAREERGFLPPLVIEDADGKKHEFLFPQSPPAEFFMDFLQSVKEGSLTDDRAVTLMLTLMDDATAKKLTALVSSAEMVAIMWDLMTQYGFETGENSPNRETRRAKAKGSRKASSSSSARSKPTSGASTS